MAPARTVVFDLDGTLVDTAPDLVNALNFVLEREGLSPIPLHWGRKMIGAGARRMLERGLEREGRTAAADEVTRLTADFIDHYAAHIADASRPFEGLEGALDDLWSRVYRFVVCTYKVDWFSHRLLVLLGWSGRF
jgi:phosphoglycolate phosphatase